jgi:hypothetical protein
MAAELAARAGDSAERGGVEVEYVDPDRGGSGGRWRPAGAAPDRGDHRGARRAPGPARPTIRPGGRCASGSWPSTASRAGRGTGSAVHDEAAARRPSPLTWQTATPPHKSSPNPLASPWSITFALTNDAAEGTMTVIYYCRMLTRILAIYARLRVYARDDFADEIVTLDSDGQLLVEIFSRARVHDAHGQDEPLQL